MFGYFMMCIYLVGPKGIWPDELEENWNLFFFSRGAPLLNTNSETALSVKCLLFTVQIPETAASVLLLHVQFAGA